MKKLVVLFLSFVFFSLNYELNADCPQGYELIDYNDVYVIEENGQVIHECNVTIEICCKWDNDAKKIRVEIHDVYSLAESGERNCLSWVISWADFFNWLSESVLEHAEILCAPEYPPCDDPENSYYELEIHKAKCWRFENDIYPGDPGGRFYLKIKPCDDEVECVEVWRLCYDYESSPPDPPELKKYFIERYLIGTPTCSTEVPTIPPEGKGWDDYWVTGCFDRIDCE